MATGAACLWKPASCGDYASRKKHERPGVSSVNHGL